MSSEADILAALDACGLATHEYYNGDRKWATEWLLKAHTAAKQNWQPIATAPKDGTCIIVGCGDEIALAEFRYREWVIQPMVWQGDGDHGGTADVPFEPTHWMPAPIAPSGREVSNA